MIIVRKMGRMGNNLFQFSVARLIAEKARDFVYKCPFDGKIFKNQTHKSPQYTETTRIDNSDFLYALEDPPKCNMVLADYFQKKDYVEKYGEDIKSLCVDFSTNHRIAIHYRIGDLKSKTNKFKHMPPEYFISEVEKLNADLPIYITSDSPKSKEVDKIVSSLGAEIVLKKPMDSIIFGAESSHKIMSLGTFSWWFGFLGDGVAVCPDVKRYHHEKWFGDIFCIDRFAYSDFDL